MEQTANYLLVALLCTLILSCGCLVLNCIWVLIRNAYWSRIIHSNMLIRNKETGKLLIVFKRHKIAGVFTEFVSVTSSDYKDYEGTFYLKEFLRKYEIVNTKPKRDKEYERLLV